MQNYLKIVFLILLPLSSFGQIIKASNYKAVYGGFDIGFKNDFTTFTRNDNNYLISPQKISYGFIGPEVYYSFLVGIIHKNKMNYEFSWATHDITNHVNAKADSRCLTSSYSSSPFSKWTLSGGREMRINHHFYIVPFLQFAYILTDFEPGELNGIISSRGNDHYLISSETELSRHHFFAGMRATFQWRFNKYLTVNLNYGYNQGLQRSSKSDSEMQLEWRPGETFYGQQVSRASHSTLSLSVYYNIKPNNDYD